MAYPITITTSAMREINRSAILEIIRRESPISRSAIAERLDVSLPTVMRIVDSLVEEGFVRPQGSTEWSGGRRRPLIEFNVGGFVVLGVDLGGAKMYGAISDLGGNILTELDLGRHDASGEEGFENLASLIDTLLARPELEKRQVRGIGVGVPGVTLHREGVVTWAYTLKWRNFPLKARLAERYHLPIIVDNDVNLAALGELWFGAGQNTQNMILIAIGTGIGAGVIIDGALYRGSKEASGEIGHMIVGREFFGKNFEEFGVLESLASGTGIIEHAREVLRNKNNSSNFNNMVVEEIFEANRKGEAWAREVIDKTVDYLAIAIANLAVSFNPEVIVLGGGVTHSEDLLVKPILQRLNGMIPIIPSLVGSSLGLQANVMGAITNVLHNTSNYYVVHKLS